MRSSQRRPLTNLNALGSFRRVAAAKCTVATGGVIIDIIPKYMT